ncbi:protein split ends-like isoform X2 [Leptopilina heterotoma]|nr:protein split ends-like isoform X2 [Leptopilina heterotoma]
MFLRRLFRKKCQEYKYENPFNTDVDFELLPLRQKVEILRALCDFRLDADNVEQSLSNLDANSLRVEPLGHDRKNSAYWYFYGTRLYREDYVNNFNTTIQKSSSKSKDKKRKRRRNRVVKEEEKEEETEENCLNLEESENAKNKSIWQVVCFTQQDWSRLVDKLKNSEYDTERKLFRTLSEDFMPEIPKLFDLKEKQQRNKLLLRNNSRALRSHEPDLNIELEPNSKSKSNIQATMSKIKVKSKADKELKKSKIHNSKKSNIEEDVPLPVSQPVQKKGRQTNNSLASAVGQIVIDTRDETSDMVNRKGDKKNTDNYSSLRYNDISFGIEEEERQVGMHKVLESVKDHEEAWPFVDPVDEEYAPRYYSVVRRPMDLSKMEEKLENGCYKNLKQFKKDFSLIVDNCRQYNGSENEYTEMAINLKEVFERAVSRYLDSELSSEEDSSTNVKSVSASTVYTQRVSSVSSPQHNQRKRFRKSSKKSKSSKFSKRVNQKNYKEDSLKEESDSGAVKSKKVKKKSKKLKKKMKVEERVEEEEEEEEEEELEDEEEEEEKKEKEENSKKNVSDGAISVMSIIKSKRKKGVDVNRSVASNKKESSEDEKTEEMTKDSRKNARELRQEKHAKDTINLSKNLKANRKRKESFEEDCHVECSKNKIRKIESNDIKDSESLITRMKKVKQKHDRSHEKNKTIQNLKKSSLKENKSYKKDKREIASVHSNLKKHELKSKTKDKKMKKKKKTSSDRIKNVDLKDNSESMKIEDSKDVEKTDAISMKLASLVNNKDLESLDSLKDKISERRREEKFKLDRKKEKKPKPDGFILSAKKVPSSSNMFQNSNKVNSKHGKPKKVVKDEKLLIANTKIQYSDINKKKKKLKVLHTKQSKQKEETPAIQALNQATEQTLNDINKWLDDAPRLSEFSSGSESPVLLPSTSDASRSAAKLDTSRKKAHPIKAFGSHSQIKKKVQRTIDRLQPGKSKGNLLLKKPRNVPSGNSTDTVEKNAAVDIVKPKRDSDDEPKLSLGSVLKNTDSIQSFCKNLVGSPNPNLSNEDEDVDNSSVPANLATKEDPQATNATNQVVESASSSEVVKEELSLPNDSQKLKSATPNLSAWFKAFGAPKSKRKDEDVEESQSNFKKESEVAEVGVRQRRMSTGGSSVSESISSFSQESPPARSVHSPQNTQVLIPATEPPIRGAGFYQDALNTGTSPYNSPYYATPPRYSAQLPPTPSPQNHTLSPVYPSPVTFEQSSLYSKNYQKTSPQASPNESFRQLSPSFPQSSPQQSFPQNSPQNASFSQNQSPVYPQQSPQSMHSPYPQPSPQAPSSNYSQPSPQQPPTPIYSQPSPQQPPTPIYSQPSPQQPPTPIYSQPSPQQPPTPMYSQPSPQQTNNFSQPSPQSINYSQSSPQHPNSPYSQPSPQSIPNFSQPSPQQQLSPYSQPSTPQNQNYPQLSPQPPVSYSKPSPQLPPNYQQLSPQAPASYSQPSPQSQNYSQTSPQQSQQSQQSFQNSKESPQPPANYSQPTQPATYPQPSNQQLPPSYAQPKQSPSNYSQQSPNRQTNYSYPSPQTMQTSQNQHFPQTSQTFEAAAKTVDQNYSRTPDAYPPNFKQPYLETSATNTLPDNRRLDFHKEEKLPEQRFSTQDTNVALSQTFQSNQFSTYENSFNERISGQTEMRTMNQEQQRVAQAQDQSQILNFHEGVYQTSFQSSSSSSSSSSFPISNTRTLYPGSHYFESVSSKNIPTANSSNNLPATKKRTYEVTASDSNRLPQETRPGQEQFGFDLMMPFSESESPQFDSSYVNSLAESVASNSAYSRLGLGLIGRPTKEQQLLTIPRPPGKPETIYRGAAPGNAELDLSLLQSLQSAAKNPQAMLPIARREPTTTAAPTKSKKGRKSKAAVAIEQQGTPALASFAQYSGNPEAIGLKNPVVTPGGSAFNFASTAGTANNSPFYDKDTSAAAAAYAFLDEFRNPNSYYSMAFRQQQQQQQQQQTPPVTDSGQQPCNKLSTQHPRNYSAHPFLHTQRTAAYGPSVPTYVTPHGPNLGVDPFQQYLHSFYALQQQPHHHRPSWL